MERCKVCGNKIVKYPLKDANGKLIWANFFKMDLVSMLFLIAVVLLMYGYITDTQTCREIIEHPIEYCNRTNACDFLATSIYDPIGIPIGDTTPNGSYSLGISIDS